MKQIRLISLLLITALLAVMLSACTDKKQERIDELEASLAAAGTELDEKAASAAELETALEAARTELAEKTASVEELEAALSAAETELTEKTAACEELTAELAAAQTGLSDKTAACEELEASLSAAETGLTEKTTSYEELEASLAAAETELAEKTASLEALEARVAELEHQVAVRDWVAEFDGGHVEAADARDQYSYLEYIYSMYGLSIDAATEVQMKQDIVETMLQTEVENYMAAQMGFTEVDADTEAELRADAAETWGSYLEDCKANLEDQADNEEDLLRLATEYLAGYGISEESLYQDSLNELARERLTESITSRVEITEDGLRALYEEKVAEDQTTFSADPGRYGSTLLYGGECYWIPEGYRTVKQILIKFDEDQSARYSEYTGIIDDLEAELATLDAPAEEAEDDETEEAPRTAEEINAELETARADLDALYAELSPAVEEVTALIDTGADFDGLVATYGGDPGSVNDDGTVNTYTVSADSEGFDPAFVTAAMSTAAIGDVSAPEKGMYGYYIVRYDGDVTPGPVDYETVRDTLSEETLSDLQDEAYEAQLAAWYEELNVVYYLNNF